MAKFWRRSGEGLEIKFDEDTPPRIKKVFLEWLYVEHDITWQETGPIEYSLEPYSKLTGLKKSIVTNHYEVFIFPTKDQGNRLIVHWNGMEDGKEPTEVMEPEVTNYYLYYILGDIINGKYKVPSYSEGDREFFEYQRDRCWSTSKHSSLQRGER